MVKITVEIEEGTRIAALADLFRAIKESGLPFEVTRAGAGAGSGRSLIKPMTHDAITEDLRKSDGVSPMATAEAADRLDRYRALLSRTLGLLMERDDRPDPEELVGDIAEAMR